MAGAAAVTAAAFRKSLRVSPFRVFDRDMDLSSKNSDDTFLSDKTYHVKFGIVNVQASRIHHAPGKAASRSRARTGSVSSFVFRCDVGQGLHPERIKCRGIEARTGLLQELHGKLPAFRPDCGIEGQSKGRGIADLDHADPDLERLDPPPSVRPFPASLGEVHCEFQRFTDRLSVVCGRGRRNIKSQRDVIRRFTTPHKI